MAENVSAKRKKKCLKRHPTPTKSQKRCLGQPTVIAVMTRLAAVKKWGIAHRAQANQPQDHLPRLMVTMNPAAANTPNRKRQS